MIRSFVGKATERLFRDGPCPARWRSIEAVALRKLDMVDAATRLDDLLLFSIGLSSVQYQIQKAISP